MVAIQPNEETDEAVRFHLQVVFPASAVAPTAPTSTVQGFVKNLGSVIHVVGERHPFAVLDLADARPAVAQMAGL